MEFSISEKTRAVVETVLIAIFILVLVTILCGTFVGSKEMKAAKALCIALAVEPDLSSAYLSQWFEKNFGLREKLILLNAVIKVKLLGVSTTPNVVLGKENWFFYVGEGASDYARALRPMSHDELYLWRHKLEKKRDDIAAQHGLYLFVVCPDKESIYHEYYPAALNKVRSDTSLDQLINYMNRNSNYHLIDLRPVLINAKRSRVLYYKHDSHWNSYGAYVAYAAIIQKIGKYIQKARPVPTEKFRIRRSVHHDDLYAMLGINSIFSEPDLILEPPVNLRAYVEKIYMYKGDKITLTRCDGAPFPVAVIFHDSFMGAMQPFLSLHFQRAYFVYSAHYRPEIVKSLRPTVVIEEIVERHLH